MAPRQRLFSSSVGTKLLIGATGFLLFLYLLIHIAGNLRRINVFGIRVDYIAAYSQVAAYLIHVDAVKIRGNMVAADRDLPVNAGNRHALGAARHSEPTIPIDELGSVALSRWRIRTGPRSSGVGRLTHVTFM